MGVAKHLVSLVVSGHGDAGRGDGGQVRADLVQTQRGLHPLLRTVHQHLLELQGKDSLDIPELYTVSKPSIGIVLIFYGHNII